MVLRVGGRAASLVVGQNQNNVGRLFRVNAVKREHRTDDGESKGDHSGVHACGPFFDCEMYGRICRFVGVGARPGNPRRPTVSGETVVVDAVARIRMRKV